MSYYTDDADLAFDYGDDASETCEYTKADVTNTRILAINMHNAEVEMKLDKIREQIDNCDDFDMRRRLTRKLTRLKRKLISHADL